MTRFYTPAEQAWLDSLPEREGGFVRELMQAFDARLVEDGEAKRVYAGAAGQFDERRNSSRVFPVAPGAAAEANAALKAPRHGRERTPLPTELFGGYRKRDAA